MSERLYKNQEGDEDLRNAITTLFGGRVSGFTVAPGTAECQISYDINKGIADVGLVNDFDAMGHRMKCLVLSPPEDEQGSARVYVTHERGGRQESDIDWVEAAIIGGLRSREYAVPLVNDEKMKLMNVIVTETDVKKVYREYNRKMNRLIPNLTAIYRGADTLHLGILKQSIERNLQCDDWKGVEGDEAPVVNCFVDSICFFAFGFVGERNDQRALTGRVVSLREPRETEAITDLTNAEKEKLVNHRPIDLKNFLTDFISRMANPGPEVRKKWSTLIEGNEDGTVMRAFMEVFQFNGRSIDQDYHERLSGGRTYRTSRLVTRI